MQPSADMPGSSLRAERERRGLTVAAAAGELGVRPGDIRALEWDRPDLLGAEWASRVLEAYVTLLETGRAPRRPGPGLLRAVAEPVALAVVMVAIAVAGVTAAEVIPSNEPRPTLAPASAVPSRPESTRAATTASAEPPAPSATRRASTTSPATTEAPPRPPPPPPQPSAPRATAPPPRLSTDARVGGVAASRDGPTITVVWHGSPGVREVRVYRSTPEANVLVYRGRARHYVDPDVEPRRAYRYRVVGFDRRGRPTNSIAVTVGPA